MPLTIAPTAARGTGQFLQPFYYASSLFVEPMKEDIASLLSAFVTAYSMEPLEPPKPFQLFKSVWHNEGWDLVHLRVLDARGREAFFRTVVRLFVERMSPSENSLTRVGAVFGLYIFYAIQKEFTGRIRAQNHITLTLDTYEQVLALPNVVHSSLRSHTTYIISQLVSAFHLIPRSDLEAQNPRTLPHTFPILTRDIDYGHKKKTGRPSQLAQNRRANETLSSLENFVDRVGGSNEGSAGTTPSTPLPERPTPIEYIGLKEQLRGIVSEDAIKAAESLTMERIRDAERHVAGQNLPIGDGEGLERLNKASSQKDGLLGLVQIRGSQ